MKRGLLIGIVCIILFAIFLSAQESQEQEKTIKDYSPEDWKSLDATKKTEVWAKTPAIDKNYFLSKNYPQLELEGLAHDSLSWSDKNKLTNGKTFVDFDALPQDVKKITFDGKQFVYYFANGEIATEVGSLTSDEAGIQYISDGKSIPIALGEYGTVRINEEGIFFKDASLIIEGRTFSPNNPQEESFVRKVEENNFLTRNTIVDAGKAIFKIPPIDTNVLFKGGSFEKKYKQFAQLYNKGIAVVGKDISTEVKDNFENFIALGENLRLINGEVEFIFSNEKTNIVRNVQEAPYEIKNINNAKDPERYFVIERTEDNGPAYVRDNQKLITAGQIALTIAGALESDVNIRAVIVGAMKVGKVDFSSIPEGVDAEGYLDAVTQSQYKSLEVSTAIDFTDYLLETRAAKKAGEYLGEDFVSMIRQGIQSAGELGIYLGVDSKGYLDEVDEAIVKTAKETLNFFNGAVATLPESREPRARTVSTLVDSFINPNSLGGFFEGTVPEDSRSIIEASLNARDYAEAYSNFADGLTKVHEAYGMIPKSTKLKVEIVGDKATGIIEVPTREINRGTKENKQLETVRFDTVRFDMDRQVADDLIREVSLIPRVREELWKDYQDYLEKKNEEK